MMDFPPVLTTEQVAELLQTSETTVLKLGVPCFETGKGRRKYVLSVVLEWAAEQSRKQGPLSLRRVS